MTDSDDPKRAENVQKAYEVIKSFTGMLPTYRNKCMRACHRLHEPYEIALEIKKACRRKNLTGVAAAKYFFTAFMNAANGD